MELMNMPVTLVVKAPNQKIADQTVECALNWTVRKLKQHLASVYPSKPGENQQRLIYSGKLLQDDLTLKDVLRQYEPDQTIHTVHLVCSGSTSDLSLQPSNTTSLDTTVSSGEGLRHRHVPDSSVSSATSTTSSTSASSSSSPLSPVFPTSTHPGTPLMPGTNLDTSSQFNPAYHGVAFNPAFAAQQYGQYSPYTSAGPTGTTPGMLGTTPGMLGTNNQYSAQQMMWMQQAYMQQAYMAQYMQYMQQGGTVSPVAAAPAIAVQQNANAAWNPVLPQAGLDAPAGADGAGNARPMLQAMRMNAQGGPVADADDDDEDRGDRDWLDWLYTLLRFAMLICILYFYSSVGRFLATLGLVFIVYIYQAGWLQLNRQGARRQRERQQQQQQRQAPGAGQQPQADQPADDAVDGGVPPVAEPERRPGTLAIAWSFIVTFFTSLAPQPPPAVNAN